jgi:hypothetical protein
VRRALALVTVMVALGACGQPERPEGIVERWLLSLNQGAAGRPDAYAPGDVSQQVLPRWQGLDPGELDVIEVGRGGPGEGEIDQVPFRVVTVEGDELRGLANVEGDRVTAILTTAQTPVGPLPSEGGRSSHDPVHAAGWLAALAVAGTLIASTWGLMALVRRSAPTR